MFLEASRDTRGAFRSRASLIYLIFSFKFSRARREIAAAEAFISIFI